MLRTLTVITANPSVLNAIINSTTKQVDLNLIEQLPQLLVDFETIEPIENKVINEYYQYIQHERPDLSAEIVFEYMRYKITRFEKADGGLLTESQVKEICTDFYKKVLARTEETKDYWFSYQDFYILQEVALNALIHELTCVALYGCIRALDWKKTHWGTYGESTNTVLQGDSISFMNAGLSPNQAIFTLSKKFPNETLTVKHASENKGYHCGHYTVKNGVITIVEKTEKSRKDKENYWFDFAMALFKQYHPATKVTPSKPKKSRFARIIERLAG